MLLHRIVSLKKELLFVIVEDLLFVEAIYYSKLSCRNYYGGGDTRILLLISNTIYNTVIQIRVILLSTTRGYYLPSYKIDDMT